MIEAFTLVITLCCQSFVKAVITIKLDTGTSFSFSYSRSFSYYLSFDKAEIEGFIWNAEKHQARGRSRLCDSPLILVGGQEKIESNMACECDKLSLPARTIFLHLEKGQAAYESLTSKLKDQVNTVNEFIKLAYHSWNQNKHSKCD